MSYLFAQIVVILASFTKILVVKTVVLSVLAASTPFTATFVSNLAHRCSAVTANAWKAIRPILNTRRAVNCIATPVSHTLSVCNVHVGSSLFLQLRQVCQEITALR